MMNGTPSRGRTASAKSEAQVSDAPPECSGKRAADLLIHIGYHKTGTGWVKGHVFSNTGLGFHAPWERDEIIEGLVIPNPFGFDSEATYMQFHPGLEGARERGCVPVLTDEMLSGNPRRSLVYGRLNADRLAETFPGARVFMIIREQCDIVRSWYKHHVRAGSATPLEKWLAPAERGFEPRFMLDHFRYDLAIAHYQKLFGADRVLVLPFEMLKHDSSDFVNRIVQFARATGGTLPEAGAKNRGMSAIAAEVRRLANKLVGPREFVSRERSLLDQKARGISQRIDRLLPRKLTDRAEARLKRRIEEIIGDRYAASNRETSRLTGIDVSEYGYRC